MRQQSLQDSDVISPRGLGVLHGYCLCTLLEAVVDPHVTRRWLYLHLHVSEAALILDVVCTEARVSAEALDKASGSRMARYSTFEPASAQRGISQLFSHQFEH